MQNIVTWCNANPGFLSAAQFFVSLVISIIAIVISISTARLPYKKKLDIWSYNDKDVPDFRTIVNIVNTGNRGVRISRIEIFCDGQLVGWKYLEPSERQYIGPTDEISISVAFHLDGDYSDKKMKICTTDTENRIYCIESNFAMG